MPITDMFWDLAGLTHPSEPWATDRSTRKGIQSFLVKRGAEEGLRRLAREIRQLMMWSFEYQSWINAIQTTGDGVEGEVLQEPLNLTPG